MREKLILLLTAFMLSVLPASAQWSSGGFSLGGGSATPGLNPIGAADRYVKVNAGGTALEYVAPASSVFALKGANSDITSLSGLSTALSVPQGGTGSALGSALFGGFGIATDTSGTVALTTTTARIRNFNNGASGITFQLPDCSDIGEATITFNHTGSSSTGDVTFDPATDDAIGTGAVDANLIVNTTLATGWTATIHSNGVNRWTFVVFPNNISTGSVGLLITDGNGTVLRTTTPGSALTTANSMTSASSLATVGTITSGVWNAGNVTSSGTVTATSGNITATDGDFAITDINNIDTTATRFKIAARQNQRYISYQANANSAATVNVTGASAHFGDGLTQGGYVDGYRMLTATTAASTNDDAYIYSSVAVTTPESDPEFDAVVAPASAAGAGGAECTYYAGFWNNAEVPIPATHGCWFKALTGTDTNWQCVCAGASATATDSGVAVQTGGSTHQRLKIRMESGGTVAKFYINDALVATRDTTNMPTVTTDWAIGTNVRTSGAVAKVLKIGKIECTTK